MENNKNKKSMKFQGDMLNFCDFIQVFVFTTNHHLNIKINNIVKCVNDTDSSLYVDEFGIFYKSKIWRI